MVNWVILKRFYFFISSLHVCLSTSKCISPSTASKMCDREGTHTFYVYVNMAEKKSRYVRFFKNRELCLFLQDSDIFCQILFTCFKQFYFPFLAVLKKYILDFFFKAGQNSLLSFKSHEFFKNFAHFVHIAVHWSIELQLAVHRHLLLIISLRRLLVMHLFTFSINNSVNFTKRPRGVKVEASLFGSLKWKLGIYF